MACSQCILFLSAKGKTTRRTIKLQAQYVLWKIQFCIQIGLVDVGFGSQTACTSTGQAKEQSHLLISTVILHSCIVITNYNNLSRAISFSNPRAMELAKELLSLFFIKYILNIRFVLV
mmetsp:Transcript_1289/g.1954  ORF Transcript_1289/g.1954 Transcript_1289/m.1954 type:complete len:118 (+) Transcript_1289:569-922(+)